MRQKSERYQGAAERTIKDIRRRTRKRYSSEEKIRIVLAGLRGEDSIAELCRQEGIAQGLWNRLETAFNARILAHHRYQTTGRY